MFKSLAFREGGHLIRRSPGCLIKAFKRNAASVHYQVRQLWTQLRHLRRRSTRTLESNSQSDTQTTHTSMQTQTDTNDFRRLKQKHRHKRPHMSRTLSTEHRHTLYFHKNTQASSNSLQKTINK